MVNISETELRLRLANVKLLALDVDGVLTDGGLYYTDSGEEMKKFNVKDGLGLKLIMQAGIVVAIITASSANATRHRAKRLGIPHVFVGVDNKLSVLRQLCEDLRFDLSQVAYVGDDINDLPIMGSVGCPLTVADAILANRERAIYVTQLAGGRGAVREICELLLSVLRR